MEFLAPPRVDAGIGIGGLEDLAVFGRHRAVPVDQHLRGTVCLAVVAVQPLHQHHPFVVDRRRAVVDDVVDAAVVAAAEAPGERQVIAVRQVAYDRRSGAAGDAMRRRRVEDRHARFGLEAVVGLDQFVGLRHRALRVAEGAEVHEREMRVVERVLHHAHRACLPLLVKLEDAAVVGPAVFGEVGDRAQRVIERHPHVAVLLLAMKGRHLGAGRNLFAVGELRNVHAATAAVVRPAVVAADDPAVDHVALRQLRGAVAAAVAQRSG